MLDKNKGLIFNVDDTRMKRRIVKWIKKKKKLIFLRLERIVLSEIFLKSERCQTVFKIEGRM